MIPLRRRKQAFKAGLLDSLSQELTGWEMNDELLTEAGLTLAQANAVQEELAQELYDRAVRLTPAPLSAS